MTSIKASISNVRNQRDLTRALDGRLQLPLMHRAGAGDAPRQNLAALGHEGTEQLDVFVVDVVDLVRAELADFAPAEQRTALPLFLIAGLLVLVAAAATAARASLSKWHLSLHHVETIVFEIFHLARGASFARLALRRQPALHAAPLRFGLALGARALDHFLFLVDAHHHVSNDEIHDAEPA